jgi:hypothetical protein
VFSQSVLRSRNPVSRSPQDLETRLEKEELHLARISGLSPFSSLLNPSSNLEGKIIFSDVMEGVLLLVPGTSLLWLVSGSLVLRAPHQSSTHDKRCRT